MTKNTYVAALALALLTLLLPHVAAAQAVPAIGTEKLVWDQPSPDLATAQSYDYTAIVDSAQAPATPTPIPGVTCTGAAAPFPCSARLPALQSGLHVLRVMTSITISGTVLASPPSLPLSLLIYAVPIAAVNVRIER